MRRITDYEERIIVAGAIMSSPILAELDREDFYDPEYMQSPAAQKILRWCLSYYEEEQESPKKTIRDIYEGKQDTLSDDEMKAIEDFLQDAAKRYETRPKEKRIQDTMVRYFQKRELELRMEDTRQAMKDDEEAERILEIQQAPLPDIMNIDMTNFMNTEPEYMEGILSEEDLDPLFTFPGAFGEMVNHHLTRKGFGCVMAPQKRGKSQFLEDAAFRALKHGNKVLMYTLGDMSKGQQEHRLIQRILRVPKNPETEDHWEPTQDCKYNQCGECPHHRVKVSLLSPDGEIWGNEDRDVAPSKYKPCRSFVCPDRIPTFWWKELPPSQMSLKYTEPRVLHKALQRNKVVRRNKDNLVLIEHPSYKINCQDIILDLLKLEQLEWYPDVLIIDYADNMREDRDAIKERPHERRFGHLRGIALEFDLFLLTASQTGRATHSSEVSEEHTSEDIRKLNHITLAITMNQPIGMKEYKLMNYSTHSGRENDIRSGDSVMVCHNRDRGQNMLFSYWKRDGQKKMKLEGDE